MGVLFIVLSILFYIASDKIEKIEDRHPEKFESINPGKFEIITSVLWVACIIFACFSFGIGLVIIDMGV